jgi:hypothetical protein
MIRETAMGKHEFTYVNMWVSKEQINHKLSNSFWKARGIHNAQITPNSIVMHGKTQKQHTLATHIHKPLLDNCN